MARITILCVDDDCLLLDFLILQLQSISGLDAAVMKATTGEDGMKYARQAALDIAIVDLGLPDMNGFSLVAGLAAIQPKCRILLVSGSLTETNASRLLHSGAHGFLLKSQSHTAEFSWALRELQAGRSCFPPQVLGLVSKTRQAPDHFSKILSAREIELLPFLGYGWTNDRLARHMGISPATVRTHLQNILGKLRLHSREELICWAIKKGFVDFRHEPADPDDRYARDNAAT